MTSWISLIDISLIFKILYIWEKGFSLHPWGVIWGTHHKLKPQWKNSIENDLEIKGCFRWGSKIKGPMKLSNPIGRESFSWTPWPLDESPKTKKWQMQRLNLQGTILNVKSIGWRFKTKNELKRERARDLKNEDASQGSKARVQLKDSICFKQVQIGCSKFWTMDPNLKWDLRQGWGPRHSL